MIWITFDTSDIQDFVTQFKIAGQKASFGMAQVAAKSRGLVLRNMRENLSGKVLKKRTGTLYDSAFVKIHIHKQGFSLETGSGVFYGGIQEYGLRKHITPKKKPYLRFFLPDEGIWITTKKVFLPPKPWQRPAVLDAMPQIEQWMTKNGYDAITSAFQRKRLTSRKGADR